MFYSERRTRESAKQRANRIPLDYHRTRTPLEKLKWITTAAVALATALYVVWLTLGWKAGSAAPRVALSPGPLASAHQMWNSQCEVCHEPGVPLREDAHGVRAVSRWLGFAALESPSAPDTETHSRCEACHLGAAHHDRQLARETPNCSSCHRDHQGSLADLRRVADSQCLRCHAEITRHRQENNAADTASPHAESSTRDVPSWREHPRSRTRTQADPSRLRFNHALHLLPGQFPADAKPTSLKRFGALNRTVWNRFGATTDTTPGSVIQLNCASCHELEPLPDASAKQDARTPGPAPSSGQTMRPIQYARHCAPCHTAELAVSLPVAGGTAQASIPHGLRRADIERQVWGVASQPSSRSNQLTPPRPLPGGRVPAERGAEDGVAMSVRVAYALSQLPNVDHCGKCHLYSTSDATEVDPPSPPSLWWSNARFNHAAHRAVRCEDCHAAAAANAGPASAAGKPPLDDHVPMLPDIDLCQRCHGNGTARSARADCVTCHDYHAMGHSPLERARRRQTLPPGQRRAVTEWPAYDKAPSSTSSGAPAAGVP